MRQAQSVIVYDRDAGTWSKYEALADASRILKVPHASIKNNMDKGVYYRDNYLFVSHEDMIESVDLDDIRIKNVGTEVQKKSSKPLPVQVYDYQTGEWTRYYSANKAGSVIGVPSTTITAYKERGHVYRSRYFIVDATVDTNTVVFPETEIFHKPQNKQQEIALRKRLGLWPYGKWEQMKTLEDWDALMLKINEEIEEFNSASYGKRIESAGGAINNKAVYQFDMDGNFIKEYPSAKQAIAENPKAYNLRAACKGDIAHCNGYKWSYTKELKQEEDEQETSSDEYDY